MANQPPKDFLVSYTYRDGNELKQINNVTLSSIPSDHRILIESLVVLPAQQNLNNSGKITLLGDSIKDFPNLQNIYLPKCCDSLDWRKSKFTGCPNLRTVYTTKPGKFSVAGGSGSVYGTRNPSESASSIQDVKVTNAHETEFNAVVENLPSDMKIGQLQRVVYLPERKIPVQPATRNTITNKTIKEILDRIDSNQSIDDSLIVEKLNAITGAQLKPTDVKDAFLEAYGKLIENNLVVTPDSLKNTFNEIVTKKIETQIQDVKITPEQMATALMANEEFSKQFTQLPQMASDINSLVSNGVTAKELNDAFNGLKDYEESSFANVRGMIKSLAKQKLDEKIANLNDSLDVGLEVLSEDVTATQETLLELVEEMPNILRLAMLGEENKEQLGVLDEFYNKTLVPTFEKLATSQDIQDINGSLTTLITNFKTLRTDTLKGIGGIFNKLESVATSKSQEDILSAVNETKAGVDANQASINNLLDNMIDSSDIEIAVMNVYNQLLEIDAIKTPEQLKEDIVSEIKKNIDQKAKDIIAKEEGTNSELTRLINEVLPEESAYITRVLGDYVQSGLNFVGLQLFKNEQLEGSETRKLAQELADQIKSSITTETGKLATKEQQEKDSKVLNDFINKILPTNISDLKSTLSSLKSAIEAGNSNIVSTVTADGDKTRAKIDDFIGALNKLGVPLDKFLATTKTTLDKLGTDQSTDHTALFQGQDIIAESIQELSDTTGKAFGDIYAVLYENHLAKLHFADLLYDNSEALGIVKDDVKSIVSDMVSKAYLEEQLKKVAETSATNRTEEKSEHTKHNNKLDTIIAILTKQNAKFAEQFAKQNEKLNTQESTISELKTKISELTNSVNKVDTKAEQINTGVNDLFKKNTELTNNALKIIQNNSNVISNINQNSTPANTYIINGFGYGYPVCVVPQQPVVQQVVNGGNTFVSYPIGYPIINNNIVLGNTAGLVGNTNYNGGNVMVIGGGTQPQGPQIINLNGGTSQATTTFNLPGGITINIPNNNIVTVGGNTTPGTVAGGTTTPSTPSGTTPSTTTPSTSSAPSATPTPTPTPSPKPSTSSTKVPVPMPTKTTPITPKPKAPEKVKLIKTIDEKAKILKEPKQPWYRRLGKAIKRHPIISAVAMAGIAAGIVTGVSILLLGGVSAALEAATWFAPTLQTVIAGAGITTLVGAGIAGIVGHKGAKREKLYKKFQKCYNKAEKIVTANEKTNEKIQELTDELKTHKVGSRKAKKISKNIKKLQNKNQYDKFRNLVMSADKIKRQLNDAEITNSGKDKSLALMNYMQKKRKDYAQYGVSSDPVDQAVYDNTMQEMASAIGESVDDVKKASLKHKTFDGEMESLINKLKASDKSSLSSTMSAIKARHTMPKEVVVEEEKITQDKIDAEKDVKVKKYLEGLKKAQEKAHQYYEHLKSVDPEKLQQIEDDSKTI